MTGTIKKLFYDLYANSSCFSATLSGRRCSTPSATPPPTRNELLPTHQAEGHGRRQGKTRKRGDRKILRHFGHKFLRPNVVVVTISPRATPQAAHRPLMCGGRAAREVVKPGPSYDYRDLVALDRSKLNLKKMKAITELCSLNCSTEKPATPFKYAQRDYLLIVLWVFDIKGFPLGAPYEVRGFLRVGPLIGEEHIYIEEQTRGYIIGGGGWR